MAPVGGQDEMPHPPRGKLRLRLNFCRNSVITNSKFARTNTRLSELPRLTRRHIAAPAVERGQRIRDLNLARQANHEYHKASRVARILSSKRLRSRAKWTRFAQELISGPGVSNRLLGQAMNRIRLMRKEGPRRRGQ